MTSTLASRLTIVLLTYNSAGWIERTLEHLTALKVPIIAVDNGSSDATVRIIRTFPGISIISLAANIGAAARNEGVRAAITAYIAFCDDDVWWDQEGLEIAATLMDMHPKLGVVNARILVNEDERIDPISRIMAASPLIDKAGIPGKVLMGFMAGASVVRRAAFLQVHGYNSKFFIGGEEEAVAWELADKGWEMRYIEDVTAYHYPSMQNAPYLQHYGFRNTIWTTWLHRPFPAALSWTWYVIKSSHKNAAFIKGLLMVVPGIPWIIRTRKVVSPEVENQIAMLDVDKKVGPDARRYCTPVQSTKVGTLQKNRR
ncbi:MAG: hypothetical protein JWL85_206 [Candidatus Saccharibacteria bacterium]|nr:hypothetical protein [Candidatus Saccharibacteria bacterium]